MTPKEKAEELILKYMRIKTDEWFNKHIAIQCALICVEEIILSHPNRVVHSSWKVETFDAEYYEQVKQEINQLT